MIRPELRATLYRWREAIYAGWMVLLGLWLVRLGGLILIPAGLALVALGLGWAIAAWRRMRFAQETQAPGLIEVDEGQVGYLGPTFGGYISLPDLVELRLMTLNGRRLWRLRQVDGQALLIPVDAAGSERLFDAFAVLPGIDMSAVVAALHNEAPPHGETQARSPRIAPVDLTIASQSRLIWRRAGSAGLHPVTTLPPLDEEGPAPHGRA